MKITSKIKYTPLMKNIEGQDGTIFGDFLFRFDYKGRCVVYSMETKEQISEFVLDRPDIPPHSNAVCFGSEYYDKNDEFPLLYTNMYNNFDGREDRLEGVCLVFRIMRNGNSFTSELVQIIRIGFVENLDMWKSLPDNGDIRPYGNFVTDAENKRLFAFTMRDKEQVTRFFEFALPSLSDGEYDQKLGAKVVTLMPDDVKSTFDISRSYYLQGACCHGGKIFSVEGFDLTEKNTVFIPHMKIVDVTTHEETDINLCDFELKLEPEFVDFYGETLIYGGNRGNVYTFEFI